MYKEIKFRKGRVLLGIIISASILALSIFFLLKPDIYIRNAFMKVEYIQMLGIISSVFSSALLFSIIIIFPRKQAIILTEEFLIDNSKYESLGKIKWKDISKIQRLNKNNIELFLNKDVFKTKKINLLKNFLLFMTNWNYKKSILISSALLDCNIEELFKKISIAHKKNKLK